MEIRNFDAYSPLHKSGHTSKGDQLKWKIDDRWYKADYMGYEGLSEVLVSDLLQKSICPFLIKFVNGFLTFLTVKKYEMYLTTIQLCSASNSAML